MVNEKLFAESFDAFLVAENEKNSVNHERKIGVYYPSELTFPCVRSLQLRYIYPNIKPNVEKLKVFKIGNLIHELLGKAFESEKTRFKLLESEMSVKESFIREGYVFQISGRIDSLINVGKQNYVVDFKTMHSYAKNYIPKSADIQQLTFYLHALKLEKGFLIYIDKQDLTFYVEKIKYNEEIYQELVQKTFELHKALKIKVVLARNCDAWNGKICSYCTHKTFCEAIEK